MNSDLECESAIKDVVGCGLWPCWFVFEKYISEEVGGAVMREARGQGKVTQEYY